MIKFVDLRRIHDPLRRELSAVIKRVMNDSIFIMGKPLDDFEQAFADYCHVKYVIGVASGGDALRLALLGLGIGQGAEVITVANTFTATVDAIVLVGAKPVLVDCDEYFNIDVDQVRKKITKKTRAIIPIHLYGQTCFIREIVNLAKRHNLLVIEDVAQAVGAEFEGKKAGSFGDVACFSFYPTKNLGALGDGGAVVTNNKKLADRVKMLRNYGMLNKYYEKIIGFNSRLDTIQAAILRVKLGYLDQWNRERRKAAQFYNKLLEGIVETPKEHGRGMHVYHLYVIKVENKKTRGRLQSYLSERGIATLLHYPVPVHLQEAYKFLGHKVGDFPRTEANSNTIISLPMFAGITHKEVKEVARSIKKFFS